jgi:hypothetical protein
VLVTLEADPEAGAVFGTGSGRVVKKEAGFAPVPMTVL